MTEITSAEMHAEPLDFEGHALIYVRREMWVLPVRSDKTPMTPIGLRDATNEPVIVRAWAVEHPNAQLAIHCAKSGWIVVDIDDEEAWQVYLTENGLQEQPTVTVITPSGGRHLWYRARPDASYRGGLCKGVDIKFNGYVLVPPSAAYSKRTGRYGPYIWAPDSSKPSEAPVWLEKPKFARPIASTTPPTGDCNLDELATLLSYIDPDATYSKWINIIMAIHDVTDGSEAGLELATRWSANGAKYQEGEVAQKWDTFGPGAGRGKALIAAIARDAGADLSRIASEHKSQAAETTEFRFETLDLSGVSPEPIMFSVEESDLSVAPRSGSLTVSITENALPIPAEGAECARLQKRKKTLSERLLRGSDARPMLNRCQATRQTVPACCLTLRCYQAR